MGWHRVKASKYKDRDSIGAVNKEAIACEVVTLIVKLMDCSYGSGLVRWRCTVASGEPV